MAELQPEDRAAPTAEPLGNDRSAAAFQAYFANLPDPAYIWRRWGDDFRLVAYNRAAGALAVSKIEQFIGASVKDTLSHHPTMASDLDRCDRSSSVLTREIDFEYPSTRVIRRLVMTFVPVTRGTAAIHTADVTERREMENDLRLSEARLREAQRIAKIGNWDWDIVNNNDWWSEELYRMLEVDPATEKPSFATFLERVHPNDREGLINATDRALATGSPHAMDVRLICTELPRKALTTH